MNEPKNLNLKFINTDEYNKCIDEIGKIINKYNLCYVEAFGVLECVKNELTELWIGQE